jgi:hypothetical protein
MSTIDSHSDSQEIIQLLWKQIIYYSILETSTRPYSEPYEVLSL